MRVENEMKVMTVVNSNISGTTITNAMAQNLSFECCDASRISFNNANLSGGKISDANLSELVIAGAQWGGAQISDVGYSNDSDPQSGRHPVPVKFTHCNFSEGLIDDSDLSNLRLENCNIEGLTINGIRIDELIEKHLAAKE